MKLSLGGVMAALALTSPSLVVNSATLPSSRIEARASWNSLGCYVDNVSGRALPNGVAVPGGSGAMTNEACQTACLSAGFSIAGTEYAGECCKYPIYSIFKLTSLIINRVWQRRGERWWPCA